MTFLATLFLYLSIYILSFSDAATQSKAETYIFLSPQDAPIYSQILSSEEGITYLWQLDYEREIVKVEVQVSKRKSNKGKFQVSQVDYSHMCNTAFSIGN